MKYYNLTKNIKDEFNNSSFILCKLHLIIYLIKIKLSFNININNNRIFNKIKKISI